MGRRLTSYLIIGLVIFYVLINSCVKKEGKDEKVSTKKDEVSSITNLITLKPGEKLILDSPKKFVELWILFNLSQRKWLEDISTQTNITMDTNVNIEDYTTKLLEEKRKEFYKNFGITEEDFTQYSMKNWKKIQEFLDKNPEYKKAYEKSVE